MLSEADGADERVIKMAGKRAFHLSPIHYLNLKEIKELGTEEKKISFLLKKLFAHDPGTGLHVLETGSLAYEIGRIKELSEDDLRLVFLGGVAHDFGKIGIPASVIRRKKGFLDHEKCIIQLHGDTGAYILGEIGLDETYVKLAREHHYGNSNHFQASDEELKSRHPLTWIIAMADLLSAAIDPAHLRKYKAQSSIEKVRQTILDKISYGVYPSEAVDILDRMIEAKKLPPLINLDILCRYLPQLTGFYQQEMSGYYRKSFGQNIKNEQ